MPSSSATSARRAALFGAASIATALALSSAAQASCQFPKGSTATPRGVAKLLLEDSEALGFAVVKQAQNASLKRPEEIEMIFALKGPHGPLTLRNPFSGSGIAMTNAQTTFESPAGSVVFAALKRTRSGWVVGECTAQLSALFPLTVLMPELRRELKSRRGEAGAASHGEITRPE